MENQVMSIFVQAVLSILGVLVSYLATVAVSYLTKKKEALINQMGADQYNATYNIAKGIFFAVEQQFKLTPNSGQQKADMFNKLLLSKVPGLTQDEIDHFREAVVGEINLQLNKTGLLDPAPSPKQ
ncbi:hypothetical protein [Clostridium sp. OS1-26]|uniref:hypothetical protein n=1 Tax=Clostridium sp. OS1-26 TaxID=3070681 RepID=UPI0027DEC2EE|nr:hypothetical protein [Clostridium sp. OS1-26]WML35925.1 hypothetical protein RCG18_04040 [Clostridium sp. OS1-26]